MAIALVQSKSAFAVAGAGITPISFNTNPSAGNFILVHVSSSGGATSGALVVSDNQGNTYTTSRSFNSGMGSEDAVAYVPNCAASGTFTVSCASDGFGHTGITISEWSGVATSSVLDQSGVVSTATNGALAISTSSGIVGAGELVFATITDRSGGSAITSTAPSTGYTSLSVRVGGSHGSSADAYKLSNGSGVQSVTWPDFSAGGDSQIGQILVFKEAAGGGGPSVSTVSSNSATEGSNVVHTVTLASAVSGSPATYALALAGVTATGSGTDFTSTLVNGNFNNSVTISGGTITVPVGVSSFTVSVPTTDDQTIESAETYTLTVGGVSGTGTINDNDAALGVMCTQYTRHTGRSVSYGLQRGKT